jgi:hypothetical protein
VDPKIRDRAIWIYHSILESRSDWFRGTQFVIAPGAWAKLPKDENIEAHARFLLLIFQDGHTCGARAAIYFQPSKVPRIMESDVFKSQISTFFRSFLRAPSKDENAFYSMITNFSFSPDAVFQNAAGSLIFGGVLKGIFWIDIVDASYPEAISSESIADIFRSRNDRPEIGDDISRPLTRRFYRRRMDEKDESSD